MKFIDVLKPIKISATIRDKISNEVDQSIYDIYSDKNSSNIQKTIHEAVKNVINHDYEPSHHYKKVKQNYVLGISSPVHSSMSVEEWFIIKPDMERESNDLDKSDKSLLRSHFYLELSCHYGLKICPHFYRSAYFDTLVDNYIKKEIKKFQEQEESLILCKRI